MSTRWCPVHGIRHGIRPAISAIRSCMHMCVRCNTKISYASIGRTFPCWRWLSEVRGMCGWTSKDLEGRSVLCVSNAACWCSCLLSVQGKLHSVHFIWLVVFIPRAFLVQLSSKLLSSTCRKSIHSVVPLFICSTYIFPKSQICTFLRCCLPRNA